MGEPIVSSGKGRPPSPWFARRNRVAGRPCDACGKTLPLGTPIQWNPRDAKALGPCCTKGTAA